jgi:hypothetical protein
MFSLRSVNVIKKASIASRIVAGFPKSASPSMLAGSIPKIASPSIQRVFLSSGASRKQQVFPDEPTAGIEINSRLGDVSKELSPTLKKFTLDGKVAVITG